ncbi:MAG: hypothetical protein LBK26_04755 [Rickettsiales bacterium]|jgi:hypothetical protein|nr:hypothetical protein [Rickettsiales bacterium]
MKKLFAIFTLLFSLLSGTGFAATNLPNVAPPNIGDFGMWATANNQQMLINNLNNSFNAFQNTFQTNAAQALVGKYVPIEAKVGRALIGALSMIGDVLDRSLFGFIKILITVLFAFWIFLEAYNLIKTGGDPKSAKEVALDIAKKGLLVAVWLIILSNNPAKIFMFVFGPIISLGAILSDMILNSVTSAVGGTPLPDTCDAIRNYMAGNPISGNIVNSAQAADLLCVPTRLSGFFYTCIAAGFRWMGEGFGNSAITFFIGLAFVVIFAYNTWKFALQALGIIASLFFAVLFLPFTAIIETFGGGASYKGPFGKLFEMFVDMFGKAKLNAQIMTFVNAVIYFIVLSVMAAIGMALLVEVADIDLQSVTPTMTSDSFMTVLIVGCLVAYLAGQAEKIAKDLGASVDKSFGEQIGKDIKDRWKHSAKSVQGWWKAIKK